MPVYGFSGDDARRLHKTARRVESGTASPLGAGSESLSGLLLDRNRQTVQVTSATKTGNLYPGKIALYDASADDYDLLAADIWVRERNVKQLTAGEYYGGEMWSDGPDGKPVFLVDNCCGAAIARVTTACCPDDDQAAVKTATVVTAGDASGLQIPSGPVTLNYEEASAWWRGTFDFEGVPGFTLRLKCTSEPAWQLYEEFEEGAYWNAASVDCSGHTFVFTATHGACTITVTVTE